MFFVAIVLYFSTGIGHEEQEDKDSWDTWFLHADVAFLYIRDYYDTEDGRNEGVVIYVKRGALRVSMKRKTIR